MPKISIIIPCYNSELFIDRAIKSVLSQTFSDWELLLIDDHSKDNTKKIIESYTQNDKRIKILQTKENSGGPALPKNIGVENARGKYIAFLDHDDEWLPEKLEKQLIVFENSKDEKLGIVSCGVKLINSSGKKFAVVINSNKNIFPEILVRNPIFSNSSVLIKKEVIDTIGERDIELKYSEDYDYWLRVAGAGYNFFYISEPLLKYYFHDNNVTKNIGLSKKVENMETIFQKNIEVYKKYKYLYIGYFRLGVMYFLQGNTKISRSYFLKSIKEKRGFLPSYAGYTISFTGLAGVKMINFFIFLYRIIKGKRYLILSK
jgi:teichuronic acid biosynthesis glycosyltransferase TuaG